jgi:hypothetical protein
MFQEDRLAVTTKQPGSRDWNATVFCSGANRWRAEKGFREKVSPSG